jgi:hypothetical protein
MKNILVVGYPKSGNTWTARLLAEVIGCPSAGFLGEPKNPQSPNDGSDRVSDYRVFKAHHSYRQLKRTGIPVEKIIYVIRDPRDIAVSGAFFFDQENSENALQAITPAFFEKMVNALCFGGSYAWCALPWVHHLVGYLNGKPEVCTVRYEDLLTDGESELQRILEFLGVKASLIKIRSAIKNHSFDRAKQSAISANQKSLDRLMRRGVHGEYTQYLSQSQIDQIESHCRWGMVKHQYLKASENQNEAWLRAEVLRISSTPSKAKRYLLCRPRGGLNDMLCQIEKCCRYAETTNRVVIVDTVFDGALEFGDHLANYFKSRQSKLKLALDEPLYSELLSCTVFPKELTGRINTYQAVRNNRVGRLDLAGEPLTFDFDKNYKESVLVHQQWGGGDASIWALLRMQLRPSLSDELKKRIRSISSSYLGVHIRHTDYRSDYKSVLHEVESLRPEHIFLATDSEEVLNDFRQSLKYGVVHSFAAELSKSRTPLHHSLQVSAQKRYIRNRDAILDLIMLGLSSRLVVGHLKPDPSRRFNPTLSGFSRLAKNLNANKIVLKLLLQRDDIHFGLR